MDNTKSDSRIRINIVSKFRTFGSLLFVSFFLISCHNEGEPEIQRYPSHRDGIYYGTQLIVNLNGISVSSVTSVTLESQILDVNQSPDKESDEIVPPINPTYTTKVTITGFPKSGKTSTFETISDLVGFEGITSIDGVEYQYVGEFTGDPLAHHNNQGLILNFSTEN